MTTSTTGRNTGKQVILYAILFLVLLWTLVPIVWMVLASFKPGVAQLSSTPVFVFKPTMNTTSRSSPAATSGPTS